MAPGILKKKKNLPNGSSHYLLVFLILSTLANNILPTFPEPPRGIHHFFHPPSYLGGSIQWLFTAYNIKSENLSRHSGSANPEARHPPPQTALSTYPSVPYRCDHFYMGTMMCKSLGSTGLELPM